LRWCSSPSWCGSPRAGRSSAPSTSARCGSAANSKRPASCARKPSNCSPITGKRRRGAAPPARAISAHARPAAAPIAAQSARDLQQSLERRQRLAEERIAQAEAKALDEIRAAAVDVAIAAAREVIVAELDERRGAAMLDAAIAALPQRLR
jgi:hypothetical protein